MVLDAAALIRMESLSAEIPTRILNASERGLLLAMPATRPVGTRIHVRVQIGDPVYEIAVAGIIVHIAAVEGDPRTVARAGILLTDVGPDWRAFCRRLGGQDT
jgi:hypothetical protein